MANSFFTIVVQTVDNANGVLAKITHGAAGQGSIEKLTEYLQKIGGGIIEGAVTFLTSGVQANGTITFSSIANNDTVTVNGRVYTAKTSGASGLQQFNIGGSDAAAALNLQAAINADTSSLVKGVVVASSSSSGVTKITAVTPGVAGNFLTIAISAHGSVSGSGLLTSGAQDAAYNTVHKGV